MDTELTNISAIHLWCANGHAGEAVVVADLLRLPHPPRTVGDVVRRARCKKCGAACADFRLSGKMHSA